MNRELPVAGRESGGADLNSVCIRSQDVPTTPTDLGERKIEVVICTEILGLSIILCNGENLTDTNEENIETQSFCLSVSKSTSTNSPFFNHLASLERR